MTSDPARAPARRRPARRRAAAADVVGLGRDDRQLDAELARERRVLHHPPEQPVHARGVRTELIREELCGRLDERGPPMAAPCAARRWRTTSRCFEAIRRRADPWLRVQILPRQARLRRAVWRKAHLACAPAALRRRAHERSPHCAKAHGPPSVLQRRSRWARAGGCTQSRRSDPTPPARWPSGRRCSPTRRRCRPGSCSRGRRDLAAVRRRPQRAASAPASTRSARVEARRAAEEARGSRRGSAPSLPGRVRRRAAI